MTSSVLKHISIRKRALKKFSIEISTPFLSINNYNVLKTDFLPQIISNMFVVSGQNSLAKSCPRLGCEVPLHRLSHCNTCLFILSFFNTLESWERHTRLCVSTIFSCATFPILLPELNFVGWIQLRAKSSWRRRASLVRCAFIRRLLKRILCWPYSSTSCKDLWNVHCANSKELIRRRWSFTWSSILRNRWRSRAKVSSIPANSATRISARISVSWQLTSNQSIPSVNSCAPIAANCSKVISNFRFVYLRVRWAL